ncbi:TonB-dependent receptor [Zavarzinia compransoris]|uniref:TonB-dependent receptor n=1 Tax=Zavarzinia compransoris TaxID=1264899 RepID=A0A317DV95_9PROT|nr:TonB-dependent receptor [Zavarzinia compransoris]PWR17796.1 hypothetical protein DKG75_21890 [Zavarzinia compransoris]TDP49328.1 iron complex outermembrane receptor protein [Zavarzinia compransoris]
MRASQGASADGLAVSKPKGNRAVTIRAALVAVLGTTALTGIAAAQQQQDGAAAADETGLAATVDDVVVTARKREEQAQDVPLPLTVISGKKLEEERVTNIRDLTQQLPNISFSVLNPRNTSFAIRGLGSGIANDGLENAVGFFVDGVYYARPSSWTFDFLELERVELLRGPQGTLFGKNTAAGALSITTAKPSFTPSLSAEASFGNYDYRQFRTRVTGPVSEDLALSLSASVSDRDGFFDNVNPNGINDDTLNDYNNVSLRAQGLWVPSENFSLRVIADYGSQELDGSTGVIWGRAPNASLNAAIGALFPGGLAIDRDSRDANIDAYQHLDIQQRGISAEANLELAGGFTLTSISAFRNWNFRPNNDSDNLPIPVLTQLGYDSDQEQFSQEIRLASPKDDNVEYVVGLYYFYQSLVSDYTQTHGAAATTWLTGAPALPAAVLNGTAIYEHSAAKTDSYAGFGQATWHVTERIDLTAGLRYTYEEKTGDFSHAIDQGTPLGAFPAFLQPTVAGVRALVLGAPESFSSSTSDGGLSGTLNLSYKADENVLVYAFYSRGFKSSGINFNRSSTRPAGVGPVVDPETVDDFEIGLKSEWLNRRLQVNIGGYWTEVEDVQQQRYSAGPPTVNFISNVGDVRARGVELEIQAAPLPGLRLTASGSYNDATYLNFTGGTPRPETPGVPTDLTGKALSGAPRWQAFFGADYAHELGEWAATALTGYVGGNLAYTGSYYSGVNSQYLKVPERSIVDLRAGIRASDRSWDLSIWSRNLFDEKYPVLLGSIPGQSALIFAPQVGDPRTVGTTLRVNF